MKKYLIWFFSILAISTICYAAAGDRPIHVNSNQDGDSYIQVNKGGVATKALEVKGNTGNVVITDAVNKTPNADGDGHLKILGAGYTGFLSLDASGMWIGTNSASRPLIFATDETERGSISGSGAWTMGPTTGAATHVFRSGTNTVLAIDSFNSSADLAFRRTGTAPGSAGVTSAGGLIQFSTGGSGTNPFLTRTMQVTASGSLRVGPFDGSSFSLYYGAVGSGTTTCTASCGNEDNATHGLDADSGACLQAWRSDTGAPITCADATSVGKKCLCAGVN